MSGLLFPRHFFAQNLVPNPSFEEMLLCPDDLNQLDRVIHWFNPNQFTSPDYYSECSQSINVDVPHNLGGYQLPRTDSSYVGIIVAVKSSNQIREYISVKLIDSLKTDSVYCVSLYVCRVDDQSYKNYSDGVGVYISKDSLYQTSNMAFNLNAQIISPSGMLIKDTTNWINISGYYTSQGGEQFISIGCFLPDSELTWEGDPSDGTYLYIDDVSVTKCSLPLDTTSSTNFISVYPNPNLGQFTISYGVEDAQQGQFSLWDNSGRLVYKSAILTGKFEEEIILPNLSSGLYLWRFDVDGKKVETGKVIVE